MTPAQTIAPWLSLLSDTLGLDSPEEPSPGCYRLHPQQAPELRIVVPDKTPILRLIATLGPVTTKDRRQLFLTLLEWNLLGQKTNGTALALEPKDSEVTLTYGHPLDHLDGEGFVMLVENFLTTAQALRAELAELQARRGPSQEDIPFGSAPIRPLPG